MDREPTIVAIDNYGGQKHGTPFKTITAMKHAIVPLCERNGHVYNVVRWDANVREWVHIGNVRPNHRKKYDTPNNKYKVTYLTARFVRHD